MLAAQKVQTTKISKLPIRIKSNQIRPLRDKQDLDLTVEIPGSGSNPRNLKRDPGLFKNLIPQNYWTLQNKYN